MTSAERRLKRRVWAHYRRHGRHDLPWRMTDDPYNILVSEVMLQQTQVGRVIPKYSFFLKCFPTVRALAAAPLADVLVAWQGLGYNRRAKSLYDAAHTVCDAHGGRMPHTYEELVALPGVGPYTAGAVCVFAYGQALPLIETNIRTVLLHELLSGRSAVPDSELMLLAKELLDSGRPREWHWALMDYGAYLKANGVRLNAQSKHYVRQQPFKGSDREVRGAILRTLAHSHNGIDMLQRTLKVDRNRLDRALHQLHAEGLISSRRNRWVLG